MCFVCCHTSQQHQCCTLRPLSAHFTPQDGLSCCCCCLVSCLCGCCLLTLFVPLCRRRLAHRCGCKCCSTTSTTETLSWHNMQLQHWRNYSLSCSSIRYVAWLRCPWDAMHEGRQALLQVVELLGTWGGGGRSCRYCCTLAAVAGRCGAAVQQLSAAQANKVVTAGMLRIVTCPSLSCRLYTHKLL